MPVRPKSIVQFEQVYWAIIALGLVSTALGWSDMMATVNVQRMTAQVGMAPVYIMIAIGLGIQLALWYFIARRGSAIAKWVFVVLTIFSLGSGALALFGAVMASVFTLAGLIGVVLLVLQVYALMLLFRADTKPWFGEEAAAA